MRQGRYKARQGARLRVVSVRRVVRTNQLILSKIDARNGAIGLVPAIWVNSSRPSGSGPTFRERPEALVPVENAPGRASLNDCCRHMRKVGSCSSAGRVCGGLHSPLHHGLMHVMPADASRPFHYGKALRGKDVLPSPFLGSLWILALQGRWECSPSVSSGSAPEPGSLQPTPRG